MQKKNYKKQTQLIRGGVTRSQHGETSEALSKGWELYGSPQLSYDSKQKKFRCGQAVVKSSKKKYSQNMKLSSI